MLGSVYRSPISLARYAAESRHINVFLGVLEDEIGASTASSSVPCLEHSVVVCIASISL